ncbi:MAG TPA: GIY-YIG nuclease family protein [Methylomirabilota bacterium]|nr:GIY-YIG nuclease family protein [Methylomirabilota bacterium]
MGSNPIGSTKFIPVFYLYILQSEATGRFYIGQTQDVSERVTYHNANYSKSLKNRGPWRLIYTEQYETRSEAMLRECQLKSWKDRRMLDRLLGASR